VLARPGHDTLEEEHHTRSYCPSNLPKVRHTAECNNYYKGTMAGWECIHGCMNDRLVAKPPEHAVPAGSDRQRER
jgi:hypothetical protein